MNHAKAWWMLQMNCLDYDFMPEMGKEIHQVMYLKDKNSLVNALALQIMR